MMASGMLLSNLRHLRLALRGNIGRLYIFQDIYEKFRGNVIIRSFVTTNWTSGPVIGYTSHYSTAQAYEFLLISR